MAKTIFKSTEKSNFILNLKPQSFGKFSAGFFLVFLIIMTIAELANEFAEKLEMAVSSFLVTILTIGGVTGLIVLFITLLRKFVTKKDILPLLLCIGMCVVAIVSAIYSFSFSTAFYGNMGRYEGVITFLCCVALFVVAMFSYRENREKILMFIAGTGIIQCAVGFLQIFPTSFPSYYHNLEQIFLKDVNLPSGLTGSPIYFAGFLVTISAISIFLSAYSKSKSKYIFLMAAEILAMFFMTVTQTLVGVIGIVISVVMTVLLMIKLKDKKITALLIAEIVSVIAGFIWIFVTHGEYRLFDGAIIFQDGFNRTFTMGYYRETTANFDIDDIRSLYSYMNSEALRVIKRYGILGTGSDCFYFTQYPKTSEVLIITRVTNSFDKIFNDYLFTLATKGYIFFGLYVVLIVSALVRCHKMIKSGDKVGLCIMAVLAFNLIINCVYTGSIATTFIFWIILGTAFGRNESVNTETNA